MAEAAKPSNMEKNLRVLTDEIGGRVPGTPALRRAVDWGMNAFRAAGADSVAIEPYNIAVGWQEGNTSVHVASPVEFKVRSISFGWSPAFSTKVDGKDKPVRIVDIGEGSPDDFKKAGNITGAILLLHSNTMKSWDDLFAEYLNLPPIVDRAIAGKAAAIASMSTRPRDLMYRHIYSAPGKLSPFPMMQFAREDAQRIARLLADGKKVTLSINMPNQVKPEFKAWNVVAEIKGSEKPDEWVLLGAHLDSWELGTGALDNGCNAALVIDALHAIKASGMKPKRSIRFVLFTGEEEGMLGSHAYVAQHHSEMANGVGVLVFDEGTGAATGYSLGGRKDIEAPVKKLTELLRSLGIETMTDDAFVGTDNLDFLLEGVPNLVANQKEANYLENYHAQSDTFDKVDLAQLRKHVIAAATTIFAIADAPERIGKRQNLVETEALIKQTKLDEQMKLFLVWDFWAEVKARREKDSVKK